MEYRKTIETTDALGQWYDAKYTEMGDGWVTPAEECNQHLDDLGVPFDRSKTLLDVGCGAGHFLAEAERRVAATGVEISEIAIECARRRCRTAGFVHGTIEGPWTYPTGFDYIVSMGSLEHVVNLPQALDNIRALLKPDGKFYFFCPNERWKHFDQPNERTMTDEEWIDLFHNHGLYVTATRRWNDSTAFIGRKEYPLVHAYALPPHGNKLCCGSGQKPYDRGQGWINVDIHDRWEPDIVANWNDLHMIDSESMEIVVAEQSVEHVGCGEANPFFKEAHRVLKPGGSLIITVPDLRALAERWLTGQIDDFIYSVNLYGAYMGHEADRHRWGTSYQGWAKFLRDAAPWAQVKRFNWRDISGPIARAWWIMGIEAIK